VLAKKDPATCDDRVLKAIYKNSVTSYTATAFQSQIEIQAAFIARRFRMTAQSAAVVASLAFGEAISGR
jgi:hypothetical protein